MIAFTCVVQEGCVPEDLRPDLAAGLARVSTSILGGSPNNVTVEFKEIPRGYGFRGGEPSTTSMVRGSVPDGCDQEVRVRLLQELSDMWRKITGCTVDELVMSARDQNYKIQPLYKA